MIRMRLQCSSGGNPSRPRDRAADTGPASAQRIDSQGMKSMCKVLSTTAVVYTLMGGLSAARAEERDWKPRRHYRRMHERIYDDWADQAVLVRCAHGYLVYAFISNACS